MTMVGFTIFKRYLFAAEDEQLKCVSQAPVRMKRIKNQTNPGIWRKYSHFCTVVLLTKFAANKTTY